MRAFKKTTVFVSLAIMLALLQTTAIAADSNKNATRTKPTYRKVTGKVMSASQTSIEIKGRSKDPLTLSVTHKTKVIGAKAAKPGDRATVNYRIDKNGKTATKIKVLPVSAKSASPPAAPAPAASSPKQN